MTVFAQVPDVAGKALDKAVVPSAGRSCSPRSRSPGSRSGSSPIPRAMSWGVLERLTSAGRQERLLTLEVGDLAPSRRERVRRPPGLSSSCSAISASSAGRTRQPGGTPGRRRSTRRRPSQPSPRLAG